MYEMMGAQKRADIPGRENIGQEMECFSVKDQIANILVFENQEARSQTLCRYLYNKIENMFSQNYYQHNSKFNNTS